MPNEKKFWRCTICGDLHWGKQAPAICPTCDYPRENTVEISKEEFLKTINEAK